jgi:DNA-binding response OmpR family regulator
MKILYAEDDVMMQKIVVRALVRLGYEVTTVDDGQEALDTIISEDFDLIILDLFMRDELKNNTPVLILSRNHLDETIQKAYTAGANDFIVKPFQPEDLVVKITRMLSDKR